MENIDFKNIINKNNISIKNIFDFIKNKNWNDLYKFINNTNMDYNIKDINNTYLIEYIIINNKIDILKSLLKYKNIRIDIELDYNKSLLYNVIKFSFNDILSLLLKYNLNSIGNNILEIKDNNGDIPIFYAINFNNIDCLNIILNYQNNFFITNNNLNDALHLSILTDNPDIFKIILIKYNNLNYKNKNGENYLNSIIKYKKYSIIELFLQKFIKTNNYQNIINSTDNNNLSILHYININMDLFSLEIINKFNLLTFIDFNIQDISGNIFYHYFINNIINFDKLHKIDSNIINNMFYIFNKFKFNINLYNIDGDTPGHILFNNINDLIINKLNFITENIIKLSDLNLQNFNGESIFFIIVKNNLWKKYYDLLIYKKLDIFILIDNNNTIFDYINDDNYHQFINLITDSYLYQLTDKNNNIKWLDYWDNRCKKNINFQQLNDTEKELIKDINIDDNKNICKNIIFNKIKNSIKSFIGNKNIYDSYSYPISKKFIKIIKKYPNTSISTISGTSLDILSGLLYLKNKSNNLLNTSLQLLLNNKEIIKCTNICEIYGFYLIWKNNNFIIPNDDLINIITNSIKNKYNYFIIPIGIEINIKNTNYYHSNYLLFDLINKEYERFEPHGYDHPISFDYNPKLLDKHIEDFFHEIKLNYFKPIDYLPKIGLQIKEINEIKNDFIGDPNGFCSTWCIWWADMRISNPNIDRKKLYSLIHREIINEKYSFRKLIRNYISYIVKIRDNLLFSANTNINEWINDIINPINIQKLNDIIKNEINY